MPETTLQPDGTAGIDNWLDNQAKTTNHGTDTTMKVNNAIGRRSILKFDLSAIAPGSTIQQAILTLYITSAIPDSMWGVDIARILSANSGWTETGSTWNTIDGSTSWAGSAGCLTGGTDFDNDDFLLENYNTGTLSSPVAHAFTLVPTAFQKLIDVGNHGFIVSASANAIVSTSDESTSSQRPKLFVRWLDPSGRLVEYTFNIWDPANQLRDSKGSVVKPNEVRPNNWIRAEGFELPRGKAYPDLVKDPTTSYIVGAKYSEDEKSVRIVTDRNQFSELIVKRLAGA